VSDRGEIETSKSLTPGNYVVAAKPMSADGTAVLDQETVSISVR